MASAYYVTRNGAKTGPFTSQQLREMAKTGQLLPTDMLWKEGFEKWKPASELRSLFTTDQPANESAEAPLPAVAATPAVVHVAAVAPASVPASTASSVPKAAKPILAPDDHVRTIRRLKLLLFGVSGLAAVFFLSCTGVSILAISLYSSRVRTNPEQQQPAEIAQGEKTSKPGLSTTKMTREEFRVKIMGLVKIIDGITEIEKVYEAVGKPAKTREVRNKCYWTWNCSDGQVVLHFDFLNPVARDSAIIVREINLL